MNDPNQQPTKTLKEFNQAIADLQKKTEKLKVERQAHVQKELQTRIVKFFEESKASGYNDQEIKDALGRFLKGSLPITETVKSDVFKTQGCEMCFDPEDSGKYWWSGKGGKMPRYAKADNVKALEPDEYKRLIAEYKEKLNAAKASKKGQATSSTLDL